MKKKVIKLYNNHLPKQGFKKGQKILGLWCKKNLRNLNEIEKLISEKSFTIKKLIQKELINVVSSNIVEF